MLWAGDHIHNGVTDVERLANFDVYLCRGDCNMIGENSEYLLERGTPGIICILDVYVEEQIQRFIELFGKRFSIIDSDYYGNTPSLNIIYYDALLSLNGKAYNVEGIQSLFMPVEEFQNTLELFAPLLPSVLRDRRYFIEEIVELAMDNELPTSVAWASPDLMHPYYDSIRNRQIQLMKQNKGRNPVGHEATLYTETTIEDYWARLPCHILTANFARIKSHDRVLERIVDAYSKRFTIFLNILVEAYISDIAEFQAYIANKPVSVLQQIYKLCVSGEGRMKFGYYTDTRRSPPQPLYGHWFS
jgi:hypothetical protein